ncbi:MAG: cell division protein ZapA [Bacteroidales bacterium]|nr:cell division protein ZapA [Bacteroidales bacterium]
MLQEKNLDIKVIIAGRPYKMSVRREKEENVRKAAQMVNDRIKEFAHSYAFTDQQDLLAMIALQNAVSNLELRKEKDYEEKEMEKKLLEIDEAISTQLSEM